MTLYFNAIDMIGTALLNRNLHEQHQRKLSEIRVSRV